MKIDATYIEELRKAVAELVPKVVPAADAARVASLDAALVVQAAQQTSLMIDRARSAAKYGPASDQVGALDLRLKATTQSMQDIQTAQARAQLQAPTVPAASAGIFGRVVDETGAGVAGASVVAVSEARASRKATSGADGSYQLVLPVRAAKTAAIATAGGSTAPAIAVHLEVAVGGKTALKSDEVLTLQAGDIVLRELSISTPAVAGKKTG